MFSINDSQMDVLRSQARQRFVDSMIAHLRSKFPSKTAGMSDEQMGARVDYGMSEARRHGIVYKDDIRRYLEYMAIYGSPLDSLPQLPWLGSILNRGSLAGTEKLDLIGEHELASLRALR